MDSHSTQAASSACFKSTTYPCTPDGDSTFSRDRTHIKLSHSFRFASRLISSRSRSQGLVIAHNASARVIRSNQSLVLQKVTRNSSGNYSCSAINAEGETVSNQLPLRVKCKYVRTSCWLRIHFRCRRRFAPPRAPQIDCSEETQLD